MSMYSWCLYVLLKKDMETLERANEILSDIIQSVHAQLQSERDQNVLVSWLSYICHCLLNCRYWVGNIWRKTEVYYDGILLQTRWEFMAGRWLGAPAVPNPVNSVFLSLLPHLQAEILSQETISRQWSNSDHCFCCSAWFAFFSTRAFEVGGRSSLGTVGNVQ